MTSHKETDGHDDAERYHDRPQRGRRKTSHAPPTHTSAEQAGHRQNYPESPVAPTGEHQGAGRQDVNDERNGLL